MAKNLIDIGINLNDGTGDNLRTAGTKINAMFQEVYNVFGDGTNLSNLVSNLHIVNDIAPQLGGNLDMNGYLIEGNGAINILSTITTSTNLVAVGAVQASTATISGNSTFGGAVTISGTTTGTVGNFSTSVTTGTLNATTELQVTGPASITGAITSGAAGSKMRFYWNNVAAFPSATTYEGGIAFAEDTNRMYFASDAEWYKLAPEEAPQLTNRVVDSVIISSPTAPTASKNSLLGGQNTTQIATLAYVKDVTSDYAPLASPALTGTPTTTTQATGTRAATGASTQIANSTYVRNVAGEIYTEVDLKAPLASPSLTGTPLTPTQATGTRAATGASTQIANSTYVRNVAVEIYNAVDLKAPLASPALTGTPTVPTAAAEINNTQIASTEYVTRGIGSAVTTVNTALALKAPLASPGLTGTPTAPLAAVDDNTSKLANTQFVNRAIDNKVIHLNLSQYAPKESPALTGTPTAPTAATGTNTTQLATTAFTKSAIDAYDTAIDLTQYAPKASPTLTGIPLTPTAGEGTNTAQIASTAFVKTAIDSNNTSINVSQYALKNNTVLTGVSDTETPDAENNTRQIPNTQWVHAWVNNYGSPPKWAGSRKFVSVSQPSRLDGVDGDIWFQIEV